ncbi:hypothetical protein [Methanogenium organophilum]|uniref:CopG family transcriptional regulator n=1 Tax=Methanogenium organophilum TaxID=2199 RepID=A0A9X9S498_METOG|nr:hypothetical protein [Methanogenium organophilum]WAI01215.1 hypothetical protein OU421_12500 [Methanogenium organophilum]
MDEKNVTVSISKENYDLINNYIVDLEYDSVDDYVNFVLSEVMNELISDDEIDYSEEDEEMVKERLRALGYMD